MYIYIYREREIEKYRDSLLAPRALSPSAEPTHGSGVNNSKNDNDSNTSSNNNDNDNDNAINNKTNNNNNNEQSYLLRF